MATEMTDELSRRLAIVAQIARDAGAIVMKHHERLAGYDEKHPVDLVTIADRESERFIAGALAEAFPGEPQILEESDGRAGARARRAQTDAAEAAWCVDPLDGTTNFVHAYPWFAVSIGMLRFGAPTLGVVYAPALGELYLGATGLPSTRNGAQIRASKAAPISKALLATGFPYDRRERMDVILRSIERALRAAHDVRRSGSASLDLCAVAGGRIDGYFELGLSPWDIAAGAVIVRGAGGALSSGRGAPLDLYADRLFASNGLIHAELEEMLA